MNESYSICLLCLNDLSDLRRAVTSSSWVVRTAARDTDCALVRVLNYAEVTLNLILIVLRCCTMILLTLEESYNMIFLRVNIDVVILIVQKNDILYNEVDWAEIARIKIRESDFVMSLQAWAVHTVCMMLIWSFHWEFTEIKVHAVFCWSEILIWSWANSWIRTA